MPCGVTPGGVTPYGAGSGSARPEAEACERADVACCFCWGWGKCSSSGIRTLSASSPAEAELACDHACRSGVGGPCGGALSCISSPRARWICGEGGPHLGRSLSKQGQSKSRALRGRKATWRRAACISGDDSASAVCCTAYCSSSTRVRTPSPSVPQLSCSNCDVHAPAGVSGDFVGGHGRSVAIQADQGQSRPAKGSPRAVRGVQGGNSARHSPAP